MTDSGGPRRSASGQWLPGNKGGPGRRPGRTPLHRAIPDERAEELWDERARIAEDASEPAERRDQAAEFILRYKTGSPAAQVPELPSFLWGRRRMSGIEEIVATIPEVFEAAAQEEIGTQGLDCALRLLERAANLLGLAANTRKTEGVMLESQQQPYTIIVQAAVPPPTPQMQDGAGR